VPAGYDLEIHHAMEVSHGEIFFSATGRQFPGSAGQKIVIPILTFRTVAAGPVF
jgi:hypothetical protein